MYVYLNALTKQCLTKYNGIISYEGEIVSRKCRGSWWTCLWPPGIWHFVINRFKLCLENSTDFSERFAITVFKPLWTFALISGVKTHISDIVYNTETETWDTYIRSSDLQVKFTMNLSAWEWMPNVILGKASCWMAQVVFQFHPASDKYNLLTASQNNLQSHFFSNEMKGR